MPTNFRSFRFPRGINYQRVIKTQASSLCSNQTLMLIICRDMATTFSMNRIQMNHLKRWWQSCQRWILQQHVSCWRTAAYTWSDAHVFGWRVTLAKAKKPQRCLAILSKLVVFLNYVNLSFWMVMLALSCFYWMLEKDQNAEEKEKTFFSNFLMLCGTHSCWLTFKSANESKQE